MWPNIIVSSGRDLKQSFSWTFSERGVTTDSFLEDCCATGEDISRHAPMITSTATLTEASAQPAGAPLSCELESTRLA